MYQAHETVAWLGCGPEDAVRTAPSFQALPLRDGVMAASADLPAATTETIDARMTEWLSDNRISGAGLAVVGGDEVAYRLVTAPANSRATPRRRRGRCTASAPARRRPQSGHAGGRLLCPLDGISVSDRFARLDRICQAAGENIDKTVYVPRLHVGDEVVRDETPQQLTDGIVPQWMRSSDHRENILRAGWTAEGIGVALGTTDGWTVAYVTQNVCTTQR
jgi:hypothetical protein